MRSEIPKSSLPSFRVILELQSGKVPKLADQDIFESRVLVHVLILIDGVAPNAVAVLVELHVANGVSLNA